MWIYQQSTGQLDHDDDFVGIGYSGHGTGLNNPSQQAIPDMGPLPGGYYTIGEAITHPHLGPVAMPLEPHTDTITFGRSEFFIHGDNPHGDHSASKGCIILIRVIRELISNSKDRLLKVVT